MADCSLVSFMKIQAKMNREPNLLAYREDERLLKRMPGYKIKMGYGLHLGWGIEGAIGNIQIKVTCFIFISMKVQHTR